MDALSEILKSLKTQHCAVGTMLLRAPWGLCLEDFASPSVLSLVEGDAFWVRMQGRPPLRVGPRDTVLFPRGANYRIASSPNGACDEWGTAWLANGLPDFTQGEEPSAPVRFSWGQGSGPETRLLGLAFGLVLGNGNPLLDALPDLIVLVAGREHAFPWVGPAIEFLASEGSAGLPGYAATARLLADLIFVSAVRSHMLDEPHGTKGWIRGLSDPCIARALSAIHATPGGGWSVGSLAQRACLSRTTFATRFASLVGESPIEYLTNLRMHLATQRIVRDKPNLTQLAFELGYTSDAAFRDAFKRRYGVPPSRYAADRERAGGRP